MDTPKQEFTNKEKQILLWASFLSLMAAGVGFVFRSMVPHLWMDQFSVNKDEVGQLFGAGPTDRFTGRSRGFAFVEMANEDEGKAAMGALDGQDFEGRALRVNEAHEREPNRSGGGGDRR